MKVASLLPARLSRAHLRPGYVAAVLGASVVLRSLALAAAPAATSTLPAGHPSVGAAAPGAVDPNAPLPPGHPSVGAAAPAVDPNATLPPGHPSVGTAPAGSAMPPGHPAVGAEPAGSAMPPGHPNVGSPPDANAAPAGGADLPPGHPAPSADGTMAPPLENTVAPAPDLGPGVVEVLVVDGNAAPIAGKAVTLGILKQEVAEGDSREHKSGATDTRGVARFESLPTGTSFSFRVTVESGPASYAAGPFRLDETGGQRATIHVFPVVRDLRAALVGTRGVVFIQPREDVFAVEVSFRIMNVGKEAWVPDSVTLPLPSGAKAFRASESMADTRVEQGKNGEVRLLGTFSPGEHEVGFQYQLENTHTRSREITVPLVPRIFELRVFAERARDMTLSVDGFPEAQPMDGENGTPLLGTGRRLARGDAPISALHILLDDMPVPSAGRWYAVALASAIALAGLFQLARGKRSSALPETEAREAESLILDELVALERMNEREQIGARTYQEARSELLDAMARLSARG